MAKAAPKPNPVRVLDTLAIARTYVVESIHEDMRFRAEVLHRLDVVIAEVLKEIEQ